MLEKYGYTEDDAKQLCKQAGLLSPVYEFADRGGCWFCPNASDAELHHMICNHPELFDRLIAWEQEENVFHRQLTRRETPTEVKARLMQKPQPGLSI